MTRRERLVFVGLPVALVAAYLLGWLLWPNPDEAGYRLIFSEQGVIEIGTAILFAAAAAVAAVLTWSSRGTVPVRYRLLYAAFALAAVFVTLEEISYGQHFFDMEVPRWFAERSTKREINLHNLYGNVPARRLNLLATIGFPLACLVLPLVLLRGRAGYDRGSWAWHLLPRRELIVAVIAAQAMTWLDDVAEPLGSDSPWRRATEMKELLWGLTALLHISILRGRIASAAAAAKTQQPAAPVAGDAPGHEVSRRAA